MNDNSKELVIENADIISKTPQRRLIIEILKSAFSALDPEKTSAKFAESIIRDNPTMRNLYVIGFGKASLKMYGGIRKYTSRIAKYSGIIIPVGEDIGANYPELEILHGNHPIPGKDTKYSSEKLLNKIREHGADDVIMVIISGGGSALFEIPEEPYNIEQIGDLAGCLMRAGANIRELNIVRQSMSRVKGGKLAGILYPSRIYAPIISDVPGDSLEIIASGPLTPPSYESAELSAIIAKYESECSLLGKIKDNPSVMKTDSRYFSRIRSELILKNRDFVDRIASELENRGEQVFKIDDPVTGDVETVAMELAKTVRSRYETSKRNFWLIGGGETTAMVHGNGIGGRNCELSLRFALRMKNGEKFLFSSVGTDGIDGISPAMGGITDSWFNERTASSDIEKILENSDSYTLLHQNDSAIITGYTGTNVSDIFIIYYAGTV